MRCWMLSEAGGGPWSEALRFARRRSLGTGVEADIQSTGSSHLLPRTWAA